MLTVGGTSRVDLHRSGAWACRGLFWQAGPSVNIQLFAHTGQTGTEPAPPGHHSWGSARVYAAAMTPPLGSSSLHTAVSIVGEFVMSCLA